MTVPRSCCSAREMRGFHRCRPCASPRSLQSSGNKPIAVSFGNASYPERPEDDVTVLLDLAENFLSRCLGGVARPLDKELIAKSSMRVLSDSGMIPGSKTVVPAGCYSATLLEGTSLQRLA